MKRKRIRSIQRATVLALIAALLINTGVYAAVDTGSAKKAEDMPDAVSADTVEEAAVEEIPEDGDDTTLQWSGEYTNEQAYGKSFPRRNTAEGNTEESHDAAYYRLYYNQLDTVGKAVYDSMVNNIESFKNPAYTLQVPVGDISTDPETGVNSIWDALAAFNYDHQEAFWIAVDRMSVSYSFSGTTEGVYKNVTYIVSKNSGVDSFFTPIYEDSLKAVEADIQELEETADEIAVSTNAVSGLYAKLKIINDTLCDTNYYNRYVSEKEDAGVDVSKAHTPAGALTEQPWLKSSTDLGSNMAPVCESYAKAFKYICDKIGISCICVIGNSHMWNYVEDPSSHKWYAVDVTWDDPIREDEYRTRKTPEWDINRYLMVGSNTLIKQETFISKHPANGAFWTNGCGQFVTPTLETAAYDISNDGNLVRFSTGVTGLTVQSVLVPAEGGKISAPEVSREGYDLEGWYTTEDYGTKWDFTQNVVKDMTLYAKWTGKSYTASFDANGGSVTPDSMSVTFGSPYGTLPVAKKDGYDFAGWYAELQNGTWTDIDETTEVSVAAAHTLYARWTPKKYTVSLDAAGGMVTPAGITVTFGQAYGELPVPEREGYIFDGWRILKDGTALVVMETNIVDIPADHTIYAAWQEGDITVTFDARGGLVRGGSTGGFRVGHPYSYSCPFPTTNREGFEFLGWYTAAEGGSLVTEDMELLAPRDHTLYAHWSAASYTVSFDAAGGEADYDSKAVSFNGVYGDLPSAERDGYVFDGWRLGTQRIEPGTVVTTASDHILVARWKETLPLPTLEKYGAEEEEEAIPSDARLILKSSLTGASIYYTLDGSDPTDSAKRKRYTGELAVSDIVAAGLVSENTITLKAMVEKDGYGSSETATFTVTLKDESEEWGDVGDTTMGSASEDRALYPDATKVPGYLWIAGIPAETEDKGSAITFNDFRVYYGKKLLKKGTDYTVSYKNNKAIYELKQSDEGFKASKAPTVIVKGKGAYSGSVTRYFCIVPNAADKTPAGYLKVSYRKKTYKLTGVDGNVTLEGLTVKDGTTVLRSYDDDPSDYDYKVTYRGSDDTEGPDVSCAGKALCILDFSDSDEYTGTRTISFNVKGKALSGVTRTWAPFEEEELPLVYGSFNPESDGNRMTFTDGEDELSEGSDYKVSTVLSGLKVTVTYTGIGRYSGTVKKSIKLQPASLDDDSVDMTDTIPYCKGGAKPTVVVNGVDGVDGVLKSGRDYSITYKNCSKVYETTEDDEENFRASKAPTVVIKGKGKYKGTVTKYYTITSDAPIDNATITVSDKVYKNKRKNWTPVMTVKDGGKKLIAGVDYCDMTVYYAENGIRDDGDSFSEGDVVSDEDIVPAGTALYVVVEGNGNYTGQLVSGIYRITEKSITKASVKVTPQYYTGKEIRPGNNDITVKVGGVVLRPGDYTVEGYSNNIKKGKAKLTIRGQRDYGGVKTVSFKIQNRPLAYTVVYAGNGAASGAVKTQVLKKPGVNYTLNANKFKRPGYEFMGWNTKPDGSGEAFADKGDISRSADEVGVVKTMYAMWRPITYTITYDCTVPDGTKTEYTPDDPDYTLPWPDEGDWPESMTFAGWFRDAKLKRGISVIKEGSYGDLKLYSGWRHRL